MTTKVLPITDREMELMRACKLHIKNQARIAGITQTELILTDHNVFLCPVYDCKRCWELFPAVDVKHENKNTGCPQTYYSNKLTYLRRLNAIMAEHRKNYFKPKFRW